MSMLAKFLVLTALVLLSISTFASAATTSERSDISAAKKFRDALPRYKNAQFTIEFNKPEGKDYAIGVAVFAIIPFVFAIFTVIVGLVFCICRCCCKCCIYPPKPQGYECKQRWVPFTCLAAFLAISTAFAVVGLTNNKRFSADFSTGSSSFVNTLPHIADFAEDTISGSLNILTNLSQSLTPTVNSVTTILDGTLQVVSQGTQTFVGQATSVGTTYSNFNIVLPSGNSANCSFCSTIGSQASSIVSSVNSQVNPAVQSLNSTVNNVKTQMVDVVADMSSAINDAKSSINPASDQVDKFREKLDKYLPKVRDGDKQRFIGTTILFLLPLTCFVMVLLALIFRNEMLFKINVVVAFLTMFFMWLILGVHLPISVLLSDSCIYLNTEESIFLAKNDSASRVAKACLNNGSVMDEFNVSSSLNFSQVIQFPAVQNFSALLDIAALTSLQSTVNGYTLLSFGFDSNVLITQPIAAMNVQLGSAYTELDINTLDPNTYASNATKQNIANATKTNVLLAIGDRNALQNQLTYLQSNVSSLVTAKDALVVKLDEAQQNVTNIADLIDPYIALANELLALGNCGRLGDLYYDLKDATCNRIVNDITAMAMAMFFIALFGTFVIVFSQISASRIPRPIKSDFQDGMPMTDMPSKTN